MIENTSVTQTLSELVGINSVSARSNEEIINYAAARARRIGMDVRLHPYEDARGITKINMVAIASPDERGGDGHVELAFVGHTDTVPFDAAWPEATTLTARDGNLYGRGACDTKGFIAAAFGALERTRFDNLTRALALVLTADEEVGCIGAKNWWKSGHCPHATASSASRPACRPIRAGKGYCLADITVRGHEGHSAYPPRRIGHLPCRALD
ncbi:MAG: M20/M25/M40 family metallo-hydrolase [Pyrinomonadaceae bacterium]